MDLNNIIPAVLIGGLGVFGIIANTVQNRDLRRKLFYIHVALWVIFMLFLMIIGQSGDFSFQLVMYLFSGGFLWPFLFSLWINQQQSVLPVAFGKARANNLFEKLLMIVALAAYLTSFLRAPATWVVTNAPVYDQIVTQLGLQSSGLLTVIPFMLIMFTLVNQRPVFCEDGILFVGTLTPWTDFISYQWEAKPGKELSYELVLKKKASGLSADLKYSISIEDKARLEPVLAQKFPVQSDSK